MTRKVLGRGLGALIPMTEHAESGALLPARSPTRMVGIEEIVPFSSQPRKRFDDATLEPLCESIRRDGLLQPLLVRERAAAQGGGFVLIAGERRWRAAQRAGLKDLPVVVKEATPEEAFELALIENLQREDLNPIEEAEAYERLIREHALTQEQVAQRVGKDRSTITNSLRLLRLPPVVREMIQRGQLSMGHARPLLALPSSEAMELDARRIVAEKLSVRQVEALVSRQKKVNANGQSAEPTVSAGVRDLEQRLCQTLGTRVRVIDSQGKGKIEIAWSSLGELDRLLDRLLAPS